MAKLLVSRVAFNRWITFAILAFAFVTLLTFRPIPSTDAPNDTGRYAAALHTYCEGQSEQAGQSIWLDGSSLMYTLTGSCLFGSERVFLFLAALAIPAAYLSFANWNRGNFLIAAAAIFSVYGLELMTNALRNAIALFFFLGALRFGRDRLLISAALFGAAGLLHSSIFVFFPILYHVWLSSSNRREMQLLSLAFVSLIGLQAILNGSMWGGLLSSTVNSFDFYVTIYAINMNILFQLFMITPLYIIFFARFIFDGSGIAGLEIFSLLYSSVLIGICIVFFPYITYRFSISSIAMQLFVITLSGSQSVAASKVIFAALSIQLFAMLAISSNYEYMWQ